MQENISVSRPTKYYKYPKNMNITLTEFFLMFRQENKSPLLENFNKSEFLLFVIYVAVKTLIYQQNLLDC